MSDYGGFHPITTHWFEGRFGTPTEIQRKTHPIVATGEHILVTAPTGSGKTLAAFLFALDRLLSGAWPTGRLSVVYVSPLKALNSDIRENLTEPLAGLRSAFEAGGGGAGVHHSVPRVRVQTRSGDTPQSERRRMIQHPPDILTTTPESLNLLLSSHGGRSILGEIRMVILDEVHAVAGDKRGVHLMSAVERLVRLSGEFQRIALSATVKPLEEVARLVGGGRPVRIVEAADDKRLELSVRAVESSAAAEPQSPWIPMAGEFASIVAQHRSSLFFTTNRRDAERIALLLNEQAGERIAYAHHGSLSSEVRTLVEAKMRAGELRAIVATSSLELGIDVGAIDRVVFAKTPFTVTSCLQMAGRAGHHVGATSIADIYPLFGRDCLNAVVVAAAALERDIEPLRPVEKPLDVLAQILVSMISMEPQNLDELYAFVGRIHAYRTLDREEFDAVIDMLAGKYRATRVRELEPRITVDRLSGTATARPGVQRLLYHSGGTIPDRGYFELRRAESGTKVGELDEEFVWERRIGEAFVLGNQTWRIAKITDRDVLVEPAAESKQALPFWRGEPIWRSTHLSDRLLRFLQTADEVLSADGPEALLEWTRNGRRGTGGGTGDAPDVDLPAACELRDFLVSQREHTGVGLPHQRRVVLEHILEEEIAATHKVILHTLWGGALNVPFSLLLKARLESRLGPQRSAGPAAEEHPDAPAGPAAGPAAEVHVTAENDAVLVEVAREALAPSQEPWSLIADAVTALPESTEEMLGLLRGRLEATGFFGGRFRENAGRALLLPKAGFDRRMPLWLTRRRARKLLEIVSRFPDFPITVETWRTCVSDVFDLDALSERISELRDGLTELAVCRTRSASPFARNLLWEATNTGVYETDAGVGGSGISEDAVRRTLLSPSLRPAIPESVVEEFRRRLQRTERGYAPTSAQALIEWVAERVLIPEVEWRELVEAIEQDTESRVDLDGADRAGADRDSAERAGAETRAVPLPFLSSTLIAQRLVRAHPSPDGPSVIVPIEEIPRIARAVARPVEALSVESLATPRAGDGEPAGADLASLLARAAETEPAERREESRRDAVRTVLTSWIRYEPPIAPARVSELLGLPRGTVDQSLAELVSQEVLAAEVAVGERSESHVCDVENLEWLLRRLRASRRPTVEPKRLALLVPFLARRQRVGPALAGREGLEQAMEVLVGFCAPAQLWEEALLPARVEGYRSADLDAVLRERDMVWLTPRRREVLFAFRSELDLFCDALHEAPEEGEQEDPRPEPLALLRRGGRMSLSDLAARSHRSTSQLRARLHRAASRGEATADSFAPLRRAVREGFKGLTEAAADRTNADGMPARASSEGAQRASHRIGRRARRRWHSDPEAGALWYALDAPDLCPGEHADLLEAVELQKDRARLLLDRYGIVFRELLASELPGFRWKDVFSALRLMELAGEVTAGEFFEGLSGPQFATPEALSLLEQVEREDGSQAPAGAAEPGAVEAGNRAPAAGAAPTSTGAEPITALGAPSQSRRRVFWLNAADPASPCGLGLDGFPYEVPRKHVGTHLVFEGSRLILVSRKNGSDVEVEVPPDVPALSRALRLFGDLTGRDFRPPARITVRSINGEDPTESAYRPAFEAAGFRADYRALVLWAGYR